MPALVAAVLAGPTGVTRLEQIWEQGDAVLPIDPLLPEPAVRRLLEAMRPARYIERDGTVTTLPGGLPVELDDALVLATSGSTGDPKGVVHTHSSIAASALATSRGLGVDPTNDRWLCCLPLNHVAGLSVVLRARWAGIEVEVLERFDPDAVTAAALERGATLTTMVPAALSRIDPSLFRRIIVGGSAPPAALPPNAVVSYGMTETGSAVVYDGVPLEGAEVRVVDGEIHVRGPMLLRCYRDGRDPRTSDGWFPTDDAGAFGADGKLEVYGRRGELIISGGENVWPVPVERVLAGHPGLDEVAVIGRPDDEWGQRVVAVVVPHDPADPPTLDELRALVKRELHPYMAPQSIEVVGALPRSAIGKLRRSQL